MSLQQSTQYFFRSAKYVGTMSRFCFIILKGKRRYGTNEEWFKNNYRNLCDGQRKS